MWVKIFEIIERTDEIVEPITGIYFAKPAASLVNEAPFS